MRTSNFYYLIVLVKSKFDIKATAAFKVKLHYYRILNVENIALMFNCYVGFRIFAALIGLFRSCKKRCNHSHGER
jgi:hypothetical protein